MSHSHRHHDHGNAAPVHWAKRHAWKFTLVVILALAAMLAYVMSMDESIVPTRVPNAAPAASAPAQ